MTGSNPVGRDDSDSKVIEFMVDVAQMVEPRIVIPVVAGSIPVVHPSYFIKCWAASSVGRADDS